MFESSTKFGSTAHNLIGYAANHDTMLPAVAGKSYRMKSVKFVINNDAASTGTMVQVAGYDMSGNLGVLARCIITPGVVSSVNVALENLDLVTKPGTEVSIWAYDISEALANFSTFKFIKADCTYTEIDW